MHCVSIILVLRETVLKYSSYYGCTTKNSGRLRARAIGAGRFRSSAGWTEYGKNAWTRGSATPSSGTGASRAHGGKWF
eukprot:COSAG01_NODE_21836_length_882_cov_6.591315_1_plen_77_part_10